MLAQQVVAVRRFSRYYTRRIGVLEDSLLGSGLSLPQGRVLYEIAQCEAEGATPGGLAAALGLDAGYISRLVASLEALSLICREPSPADGRSSVLRLTDGGQRTVGEIDERSREEVAALLSAVAPAACGRIVHAMGEIERCLEGGQPRAAAAPSLRGPLAGDIGWVVHRHGALYGAEYGWDWTFEAMVAKVAGEFIEGFDPARHCCRIADADGRIAGSAFVVGSATPAVAKLRLVYVEPEWRGTGLGRRLVEDCMAFARGAGYRRMTLWTNDVLVPARRLYERLGFEMTAAEPYLGFGHDLVGETWERDL